MEWTLAQIAEHIDGEVVGDPTFLVDSFATLQGAANHQISFLSNKKYRKYLSASHAGAVIIQKEFVSQVPCNAIVVDDAYIAYAKAAMLLNPQKNIEGGCHPSASIANDSIIHSSSYVGPQAVIESGVEIEQGVIIGPGCIVKEGVRIAEYTRLSANVTVCEGVKIGARCIFHPGVVIGADGFGIANNNGRWIKVPQVGSVVIGDDVEVGANTTIDCGAIENTEIGNNVKLDNQIQIAHNVVIGDNTVIAACVGVSGSTHIGKNCIIGGGVGMAGHLEITDNVMITGNTMVTKSITRPGSYSSGIPAEPTKQWHRNVVRYRQMDKLTERVKQLELQLNDS